MPDCFRPEVLAECKLLGSRRLYPKAVLNPNNQVCDRLGPVLWFLGWPPVLARRQQESRLYRWGNIFTERDR